MLKDSWGYVIIQKYRTLSYFDNGGVIMSFGHRHKLLEDRLLSQGYTVNCLRNSFQKCYGKYSDLVAKYQKSVRDMLNDSFSF